MHVHYCVVRFMFMLNCLNYMEGRVVFLFVFLTEVTGAGKKEEKATR